MVERTVIGVGHLKVVKNNLSKSISILNQGKDIFPYCKWQDKLNEIIEEIDSAIKDEGEIID